ncbi:MAG: Trk system potassium transporter TrkA [Lachnospiraceae bacterium]|nr:Trk system potassium transporter TrkA [Lachnospiraceae bacterium]
MLFKTQPANAGLNIIIVGCGKVGSTLVERLTGEGHDVTIIDEDAERIQELADYYDVMGIVGNGASHSIQEEAGIQNAHLFIAVTESDELNLLCCIIAKQDSDCSTIARIRTPDYIKDASYLCERLGLAMVINPELEASREVARLLYLPAALEINSFGHGKVELIKIKIAEDNLLAGLTIVEFSKRYSSNILICAIERNGEVFIPSGNSHIEQGDMISFLGSREDAAGFLSTIGFQTHKVKNTMIIGGGKASYYLAKQLLQMGIDVKIIEQNRKRCEELSILLPKAIIINGDGTDQELLVEEGIDHIESFVPLTGIDEENIMLTLYARQVSDAKVITKINRMTFKNVIDQLELGSVFFPRYITAEKITAYVRAKKASINSNVETLYHMFDSKAEAIEFRVNERSEVTNIPLMDLPLKKNLLVACIIRNGLPIIPTGRDDIQIGDTVMIVTTHTGFNDLQDILA